MKLFKVSTVVIGSLINGMTSDQSDNFYWEEGEAATQILETIQFIDPMLSQFRYSKYGCHCFQKGTQNAEFTGKGPAVDEIDKSCLKMHQCQRCLGIDNGKECNHNTRYSIDRKEDLVTGQRTVMCTDEPGSCARNLCECSVAFAYNIKKAEDNGVWSMGNLQEWGGFDTSICVGHGATGIVHGAYTETTAEELAIAMQAPAVEPTNVRARFLDVPNVQLKFATTEETEEPAEEERINFGTGGKFYTDDTTTDTNVRSRPTVGQTTSYQTTTETDETSYDTTTTVNEFVTEPRGVPVVLPQNPAATEFNPPSVVYTTSAGGVIVPETTPEPPREMCCGSYSDHRFPYWSQGRGCCNGKTFDSVRMKCCNGVIKSKLASC